MRRKRRRHLTSEARIFAAGINLAENPNRAKRHVARLTDAFLIELAECERKAYSPLTVYTPIKRARIEPRFTSYTV